MQNNQNNTKTPKFNFVFSQNKLFTQTFFPFGIGLEQRLKLF